LIWLIISLIFVVVCEAGFKYAPQKAERKVQAENAAVAVISLQSLSFTQTAEIKVHHIRTVKCQYAVVHLLLMNLNPADPCLYRDSYMNLNMQGDKSHFSVFS
jgi:hypothetical protein